MGVCVLQIQEKKESVDSKLARGRVSKLLHEVAIDLGLNLTIKTSILLYWIYFILRIVRSNLPQIFTLKRFIDMIYLCLT